MENPSIAFENKWAELRGGQHSPREGQALCWRRPTSQFCPAQTSDLGSLLVPGAWCPRCLPLRTQWTTRIDTLSLKAANSIHFLLKVALLSAWFSGILRSYSQEELIFLLPTHINLPSYRRSIKHHPAQVSRWTISTLKQAFKMKCQWRRADF